MRTYVAGTVCAVLLGVTSLAQAGQLLSPPYSVKARGSNVGTKAACVIRNTGTEAATVSVSLITNNNGAVGIFDFCKRNGSLGRWLEERPVSCRRSCPGARSA
jgi:hypothetical protein